MELTLEYIYQLSANREGRDVEFKETTGQLNRGMETLCGMMNGDGGIVAFGIHNNGKVVGQDISDKTTRDIGEALRKFDPATSIQPTYMRLNDSDKMLVVFLCNNKEPGKPFMWDGKPYQRHDSVTSVMPREKFLRLCEMENGLTYKWENIINESLSISNLDEELIHNIVTGAVRRGRLSPSALNDTTTAILKRFKIMKGTALCNSAALLFGKHLYDYNNFKLRLARFKGTTSRDFIDNMQVEGNIFELIDAAMSFFFKHLSLSGTTHNRIERHDELEIPYDALREAVVNALCHRAWQYESSTIGIAIFDDRVEIENAGHFPARVNTKDLMAIGGNNAIASLPTNPVIANIMYLAGYIENWGRGLSLMHEECIRLGLPQPKIKESGNMVKLVFIRIPEGEDKVHSHKDAVGHSKDTVGHSKDTVPDEYAKYLPIISIIGEEWFSATELCKVLGFNSKSTFIRNYLSPAMSLGLVCTELPNSPNDPKQRYGLTVKGKSIYYTNKNCENVR